MFRPIWLCAVALAVLASPVVAQQNLAEKHPSTKAVLWSDPGDIRSRDLFYGPGGKDGQPQPPFKFEKENTNGNSPKFDVRDAHDEKWTAKLAYEARPETSATRLMWAVGYVANIDYFIADLHVEGMPQHLKRGGDYVAKGGEVFLARLQRKPGKNHEPWSWRHNPFSGTREFNGLRVMMALLNNWDLKDDNNASYEDKDSGRTIYYVTDLGASFGPSGKSYSDKGSRGNIKAYSHSKFVSKVTPEYVSFNFPTPPAIYHIFNLPYFIHQLRNRWIGKKIPRQDVKWIASLLTQLTPEQIHDAFRAGGYNPEQVEAFSAALQARIAQLSTP